MGNRAVGVDVETQVFRIEEAVANPDALNYGDDQAVAFDFNGAVFAAFEGSGAFSDTGNLYGFSGLELKSAAFEFADTVRSWSGSRVHLCEQGLVEHVDDELLVFSDVDCGVFGSAVFLVARSHGNQWWVKAAEHKIAVGCSVDHAIGVDGCDPGHGAGGNNG